MTEPNYKQCLAEIYNVLGQTTFISQSATLPISTIQVSHTYGFPTSGTLYVWNNDESMQTITYTGKNDTSFTGCSGGTGILPLFLGKNKPKGSVQGYNVPAKTRFLYSPGDIGWFIHSYIFPTELDQAITRFEAQIGINNSKNPNNAQRVKALANALNIPCDF